MLDHERKNRMRLPNGIGSVTKMSGNRRKSWIARKTVGYTEDGKQKRLVIGYYTTKAEAVKALSAFSEQPYDISAGKQKFSEIYEQWFEDFSNRPDTSYSSLNNYRWAYNSCSSLYSMKMSDIRPVHMQDCLNQFDSYARQRKILLLFHRLYEYCIKRDYLQKDYSQSVTHSVKATHDQQKVPFADEEIERIWKLYSTDKTYGMVLILLYTGVRIGELLNLKSVDVFLDEQYFRIRKAKTESGVRIVPIADKILPIFRDYIEQGHEYAITTMTGKKFEYSTFRKEYWIKLMEQAKMEHTIHETRHTFITNMTMANVNHTLIKIIAGHKASMDLTERVYTHGKIKEMIKAVNLLP